MADLAKKNDEKDALIAKRDQEIALLKNVVSPYRKPKQDKPEGVEQAVDVDQDSHKEVRADFNDDMSPSPPRRVRFESEHIKEADIEADTMAPTSNSSEDVEVNSPPFGTEGLSWQRKVTNYFSERARILAEAAHQSLLACFALPGLCTATKVEEEATFQSTPPLLDGLSSSAAEPPDVALIMDEDDKDIEMPCVECIVKKASGTRAFLRKTKASSWIEIRASNESTAPGNSSS